MMDIEFFEVQRLTDSWLGKVLGAVLLYTFIPVLVQFTQDQPSLNNLLPALILVSVVALFFGSRLDTQLDSRGVTYQFLPFHRKPRFIAWEDIKASGVRQYKPLREFGGWGIRFGRGGLALSTCGHHGLQLVLASGRHILIGTQKKEHMVDFLKSLESARM